MNEDTNNEEIRITGEALGEWPQRDDMAEEERHEIDTTKRVARMVSEVYAQEEKYLLTDAQRQLLLGGSRAIQSLPTLAPRDRKVFVKAVVAGIGVAAALVALLAILPAPTQETAKMEPKVEWIAPEEVEGVVMRVLILEKPLEEEEVTLAATDGSEKEVNSEGLTSGVEPLELKENAVVEVPRVEEPASIAASREVPFRRLLESLAGVDAALLPVLDFDAAVEGLDELVSEQVERNRWRLARYDSLSEANDEGRMLQRLTFLGPTAGIEEPMVAVKFDKNRVSRFRPVETAKWTDSEEELVIDVPQSAAFQGGWQLLLEVEPKKAKSVRPGVEKNLASSGSSALGDVVVAGDGDQSVARLKGSGEMKSTPSMRQRLAIARFARWLEARDVPAGELVREMKEIAGADYDEVERRLIASLRLAGTK
ncbi:MAG: hypothetical protein AAGA58_04610 [Verrucomicrobiota bacterium]